MNPSPSGVCSVCGEVSRLAPHQAWARCPQCHARLHRRKPGSLERCWALLIAALICYFPANILPIMITSSLFKSQSDTVLSGVVYLWKGGSWPLALVVFVASILVPILKILCLLFLLLSIHFHWRWAPLQRTRLYRLLDVIGRWSMLDIYVLALLTALVNMQSLATIVPGPGALAFTAMVVLTLLSALAFDPRLIWDASKDDGYE